MVHYDDGYYEINKEEIPKCKEMFKKKFPNAMIIRSYFAESMVSSETYYFIEYEEENGDRDIVRFCLDFNEEEEMVELMMLDYMYQEIDSDEIKFARG